MTPDRNDSSPPNPSTSRWRRAASIERTIGAGYLVAILLSLLIGLVASFALERVVASRERVEDIYERELLELERLRGYALGKSVHGRGYLQSHKLELLDESDRDRKAFDEGLRQLAARAETPHERELLEDIVAKQKLHQTAFARAVGLLRAGGSQADVSDLFDHEVIPKLVELEAAIDQYAMYLDSRLEIARDDARATSARAERLVLLAAGFSVFLAAGLGVLFTRTVEKLRKATEERLALLTREEAAHAEAEAARRDLKSSVERLERVNADLDAFAGRIAHDLRNLLAPIALVPARLRRARDEAAIERIATSLECSTTRANAVLEGLLAFSRSDRPADPCRSTPVRDVVAQVVEDLAPLASSAQAEVTLDLEDTRVACAPELLHVVLMNLLGNALKYLGDRPERRVCIRSRAEGENIAIHVEDTGPGIPESGLARLFEPFYRVPDSKAPGTGIGLATVRRIVTAHGGRVVCSSEVGRGSTFSVWLPRRDDDDHDDREDARPKPMPESAAGRELRK